MARPWEGVISRRDLEVYGKAGYGKKAGLGKKPAVLVVDVTYAFVGDKPEPILKSIERYPNSCGEEGWRSVYRIRELLDLARAKRVPIVYTASGRTSEADHGRWADKHARVEMSTRESSPEHIVREIAPQPNDIIISKLKPSGFHGTPLLGHLVSLGVDSLLVTGCTTSGCVRATVVDAFSYNYRVTVIEECVFDRGEVSHKVNLFDMQAKYADVITLNEVKEYLNRLQLIEQPALRVSG